MPYFKKFKGSFIGVMQWGDFHTLLQTLRNNPDNWHIYNTLELMPTQTLNSSEFIKKIDFIKLIIESEHKEKYCGIVYVDNLKNPTFVKFFHPKNLGKTCGSSKYPPMPQWLISKEKPMNVVKKFGAKEKNKGFISKFLKF
jgi:hypothetical protein